ncbi:MAG: hypothetical protein JO323_06400 [Acidobacteriia bacterium]|nr:hypothetical protein [Terriglobia bacterium]
MVNRILVFTATLSVCGSWMAASASGATIAGTPGLTVSVDPGGAYDISAANPGWHFHGAIGYALSNLSIAASADTVGHYSEISFDFTSDAPRHAAIRAYGNRAAVLFTVTSSVAAPNTFSFPNWTQYPQNLSQLSYSGIFAVPGFNNFAAESPWVFFDSSGNTFIVSAASNFMASATQWGPNHELSSGISSKISTLPAGFQHRVLLTIEPGINSAYDTWGQALLALHNKVQPANDADASLARIGYWTDNGATYYYHTGDGLSYEDTLSAVKADFDHAGIALGYLQLDSWFYPKGPNAAWNDNGDGIYQYTAAPALFPESLGSFQQRLGVPLITHARWIDPSSPYHQLDQMSGNVVTDPQYWNSVAGYLSASGVAIYEQDWLDDKAQPAFNLADPEAFLGNMSASLSQRNITIQYCMPSPRHFLQSVRYKNLTTIRTSSDRFGPARWNSFLFTSRLASALGIWPFTDVFMSSEPSNLLVATLSAGPVGVGDPIGGLNPANLSYAVRPDGVIVKPDVPLVPLDRSYFAAANNVDTPLLASAYTDFGALRAHYLVAFATGSGRQVTLQASDFGAASPVYLYDFFGGSGQLLKSSDTFSTQITGDALYLIAAPVGPSGIAILGDLNNYVSLGKKRITALTDTGTVHLSLAFAAGEHSRIITGYSPAKPVVRVTAGALGAPVTYDPATQQFQINVKPAGNGLASLRIHQRRPTLTTLEADEQ